MKTLDLRNVFFGHVMLYAKGHYHGRFTDKETIEDLCKMRMIYCDVNVDVNFDIVYSYICREFIKIMAISEYGLNSVDWLLQSCFKSLGRCKIEANTTITAEKMVCLMLDELAFCEVKDKDGVFIQLPEKDLRFMSLS